MHGPLDESGARFGGLPRRPERVPAGDLLEHDPASALAVARGEKAESGLHALRLVLGGSGELLDGERRRRDHEQRLDGAREAVDGVVDQAKAQAALFHTVISSKGAACPMAISPALRKLEQGEEGDGLLDPRERLDLLVEDEAAAAAKDRAEALEEERDRREGQRDVAERRRRRFRSERAQSSRQRFRLLGSERTLGHGRERRRSEAEEAVGLGVELVLEPARGGAEAPVLGQELGELARGVVGVEVLERHLFLLREEPARFQLQERGDEDEELAVHLEILAALLQECEDDLDDLDVRKLELLLEDEREQEVERPLEGVEVERELCDGGHGANRIFSGGRGLSAPSSSAPAAEPWAAVAPRSRSGAATRRTPRSRARRG